MDWQEAPTQAYYLVAEPWPLAVLLHNIFALSKGQQLGWASPPTHVWSPDQKEHLRAAWHSDAIRTTDVPDLQAGPITHGGSAATLAVAQRGQQGDRPLPLLRHPHARHLNAMSNRFCATHTCHTSITTHRPGQTQVTLALLSLPSFLAPRRSPEDTSSQRNRPSLLLPTLKSCRTILPKKQSQESFSAACANNTMSSSSRRFCKNQWCPNVMPRATIGRWSSLTHRSTTNTEPAYPSPSASALLLFPSPPGQRWLNCCCPSSPPWDPLHPDC